MNAVKPVSLRWLLVNTAFAAVLERNYAFYVLNKYKLRLLHLLLAEVSFLTICSKANLFFSFLLTSIRRKCKWAIYLWKIHFLGRIYLGISHKSLLLLSVFPLGCCFRERKLFFLSPFLWALVEGCLYSNSSSVEGYGLVADSAGQQSITSSSSYDDIVGVFRKSRWRHVALYRHGCAWKIMSFQFFYVPRV